MRNIWIVSSFITFSLLSFRVDAQETDPFAAHKFYWSHICNDYVYKFDLNENLFELYSLNKITSGKLIPLSGEGNQNLYELKSDEIKELVLDTSHPDIMQLKDMSSGKRRLLSRCDKGNSEDFIKSVKKAF